MTAVKDKGDDARERPLVAIAEALHKLGTTDASTDMGAIEVLAAAVSAAGTAILDGHKEVSGSIDNLARSVQAVADAINAKR